MDDLHDDHIQFIRAHIRQHVQSVTNTPGLSLGVEMAAVLRMVTNLYEATGEVQLEIGELTRARWGVLFRLLGEERRGNLAGLSPTYLSRCLSVSKNSVSSLLRSLEAQGLIRRTLDSGDRRRFYIQLTEAGRALVDETAPHGIAHLNRLLSDLTSVEREQLLGLLEKLYRSILVHGDLPETPCTPGEPTKS